MLDLLRATLILPNEADGGGENAAATLARLNRSRRK
jgi:hypothetical protein